MNMLNVRWKTLAAPCLVLTLLVTSTPSTLAAPAGTSEATVLKLAKGWIGTKVVHGGNSTSQIDCSHLVYQVYTKAGAKGYSFMKVPAMRASKYFTTTSSPRIGDVVFWKKDVKQNGKTYYLAAHVGIYIGGGKFIHASNETRRVTTDSLSGIYKSGQPYYAKWTRTK